MWSIIVLAGILGLLISVDGVRNDKKLTDPSLVLQQAHDIYPEYNKLVTGTSGNFSAAAEMLNPGFVAFGFPKAGSTSLYGFYVQHPDSLQYGAKEPNYWISFGNKNVQTQLAYLASKFPPRSMGLAGDFSICMSFCANVPRQLSSLLPTTKLIAVMREPVDRTKSHFEMCVNQVSKKNPRWPDAPFNGVSYALTMQAQLNVIHDCNKDHPDKTDSWRWENCYVTQSDVCQWNRGRYAPGCHHIVVGSMYIRAIELWADHFPLQQPHFIMSEDMRSDPQGTINKMFSFLGLRAYDVQNEARNTNKHRGPIDYTTYTEDDELMKSALRGLYQGYNAELRAFLDEHKHAHLKVWDYSDQTVIVDDEVSGFGVASVKSLPNNAPKREDALAAREAATRKKKQKAQLAEDVAKLQGDEHPEEPAATWDIDPSTAALAVAGPIFAISALQYYRKMSK